MNHCPSSAGSASSVASVVTSSLSIQVNIYRFTTFIIPDNVIMIKSKGVWPLPRLLKGRTRTATLILQLLSAGFGNIFAVNEFSLKQNRFLFFHNFSPEFSSRVWIPLSTRPALGFHFDSKQWLKDISHSTLSTNYCSNLQSKYYFYSHFTPSYFFCSTFFSRLSGVLRLLSAASALGKRKCYFDGCEALTKTERSLLTENENWTNS